VTESAPAAPTFRRNLSGSQFDLRFIGARGAIDYLYQLLSTTPGVTLTPAERRQGDPPRDCKHRQLPPRAPELGARVWRLYCTADLSDTAAPAGDAPDGAPVILSYRLIGRTQSIDRILTLFLALPGVTADDEPHRGRRLPSFGVQHYHRKQHDTLRIIRGHIRITVPRADPGDATEL